MTAPASLTSADLPPSSSSTNTTTTSASPTFTLLYFAAAQSYTSKSSELFPAPLALSRLFSLLEERYVGIRQKVLDSCLVTVNLEYVDVDAETEGADGGEHDGAGDDESGEGSGRGNAIYIQAGDEVAIIPPVSAG